MSPLILFLLILGGLTNPSSAESALTQAAAQDLLDQWLSATSINCAVMIPVGEHKFPSSEATGNGDCYELVQTATAMEKIGVIQPINFRTTAGVAHFSGKIGYRVDMNQIGEFKGEPCIKFKVGDAPVKPTVTRVELVKGGKPAWEGAIIYASSTDALTELYKAYRLARNLPDISSRRLRYLFRYDASQRAWQWTGQMDVAPLSAGFLTRTVLDGLSAE